MREITDEGYVVHRRRLRESSYVLQVLTRTCGQLSLVMRGGSPTNMRRIEIPIEFKTFQFTWAGKAEMPTIRRAEASGLAYRYVGDRLFCGLYVNELVSRFLHRGDANAEVFSAYEYTLRRLSQGAELEPLLRSFEVALLKACGYEMALENVVDLALPLDSEGAYFYVPEFGAVSRRPADLHREVSGASLLALAGRQAWTPESSRDAKRLMRFVIQYHLGGRELTSRTLFKHSSSIESE